MWFDYVVVDVFVVGGAVEGGAVVGDDGADATITTGGRDCFGYCPGAAEQKGPNQLGLSFNHTAVERALPDPARSEREGILVEMGHNVVEERLVDAHQWV